MKIATRLPINAAVALALVCLYIHALGADEFQDAVDAEKRNDFDTAAKLWAGLAEHGSTAAAFNYQASWGPEMLQRMDGTLECRAEQVTKPLPCEPATSATSSTRRFLLMATASLAIPALNSVGKKDRQHVGLIGASRLVPLTARRFCQSGEGPEANVLKKTLLAVATFAAASPRLRDNADALAASPRNGS